MSPDSCQCATTMILISWNVNGIRAAGRQGLGEFVQDKRPDVLCLQEVKASANQVDLDWANEYHAIWNSAEKPGYSGTLTLTRTKPLRQVRCTMPVAETGSEGRVQACEFESFILVNVYTPNSQRGLTRLAFREEWDRAFLAWLKRLKKRKPVAFCGDLNVAHKEIDLANPRANRKNAGFTDQERAGFDNFEKGGFIDTFREFNQEPGQYTWWTYRNDARARNIGWRLDYWIVSTALRPHVLRSEILPQVTGSDHCPVLMELEG